MSQSLWEWYQLSGLFSDTGRLWEDNQTNVTSHPPAAVGPRYLVDQRHLAPAGISSSSEPVKLTTPTPKQLAFPLPAVTPTSGRSCPVMDSRCMSGFHVENG